MNKHEREVITDLRKCNFNELAQYYKLKAEERKNMSKEEKQVLFQFQFYVCLIKTHPVCLQVTVLGIVLSVSLCIALKTHSLLPDLG